MKAVDPNVQLIEATVQKLGDIAETFVFVGGSTTGLLITDIARAPVRATIDVDVIVETISMLEHQKLGERLRAAGFREDHEVICRWRGGELILDVMPIDPKVLGFSNRWYPLVAAQYDVATLPSGRTIRIITPTLFIATKLEAYLGRGNGDFLSSRDIEDIVTVFDGRSELVHEIQSSRADVRDYIAGEIDDLLADEAFVDNISGQLPPDARNQGRVQELVRRLRAVAEI